MTLKPIADRILETGSTQAAPAADAPAASTAAPAGGARYGRRGLVVAGLAALVVIGGAVALYTSPWGSQLAASVTGVVDNASADNATANNGGEGGDSVFADHAREAGMGQCRELFTGLGAALVGNGTYSAMTRWDETDANSHAVHSLVGIQFSEGEEHLAAGGLVFAAPVGSGCEGNLTRIVPTGAGCDVMAGQLPQGSTAAANLAGTIVYNLPDGGTTLLVPAPQGCVMVTTVAVRN